MDQASTPATTLGRGADDAPPEGSKRRSFAIFAVLLAGALAAGTAYWLHIRNFATTDDAFIDGHIAQVSAETSGRIIHLYVSDNETVTPGQVLLEIDPADARIALARADAGLAQARAALTQAEASLAARRADASAAAASVDAARADVAQAQGDLARYQRVSPAAITRQTIDTAGNTQALARARLENARHAADSAAAQVGVADAAVLAARANLQLAAAERDAAALTLSRTRLLAPLAGRVTRRTVEVGNVVASGAPLLAIVQPKLWVTANYKETQLARMRPGQAVDIAIDAYPDAALHGHVESIQSGTGSIFSALPAENATGNYVKVVQRVPVKIVFDSDPPDDLLLAPGMSVVPSVHLGE